MNCQAGGQQDRQQQQQQDRNSNKKTTTKINPTHKYANTSGLFLGIRIRQSTHDCGPIWKCLIS